ncbi:MAG TPA: MFS transporter [Streptosporangiaceae bacterium]
MTGEAAALTARPRRSRPPRPPHPRGLLPEHPAQRVLTVATFVISFGGGTFTTGSALYFTRIVGLPAAQVAAGLAGGAMAGLVAGVIAGRLADRWGAKRTQVSVMAFGAAAISTLLLARSLWPFLLASLPVGMIIPADRASKAPLIRAFGGDRPTVFRGYLRSVTNLAFALGATAGGVAVQLDTRAAYLALLGCRALMCLCCALVLLRLPGRVGETGDGHRRGWASLRDRPYLRVTLANTVMSLHYAVPGFLLPLWIVGHTDAPRWTVSGALILNTAMVIVLQVRASRNVDTIEAAGQRMRWAGAAFLAGLALMALAAGPSPWAAVAVLAAGMAAYTFGELWHAAAATEYSFGLAPAHLQGQYAGVFGLGAGVADAVAPALMGALPLAIGLPGWLLLGAVFLVVGSSCGPLVARARGRAPRSGRASR